ncbi:MAG: hypothetical protein PWQ82_1287, partial [Thermosediminibacterales bacterium]|nr:hypothetical protein [Thermosediminibacterales bacterium]MDK2836507.1 hypothetical protein [Thermosediminibacterales bacterium]
GNLFYKFQQNFSCSVHPQHHLLMLDLYILYHNFAIIKKNETRETKGTVLVVIYV